jgi:opacity protein-like surface antigen
MVRRLENKNPINMKAILRTLAIATCLVTGTCAYAQQGFIRPELSYNFASLNGSDATGFKTKNSVGYGVTGGGYFGAQNEHEIGLGIGIEDFSLSSTVASVTVSGKAKTVPVLVDYRYCFGAMTDMARFYVGPYAGYTNIKYNVRATVGPTTVATDSSSGSSFTWGAGLGVLFKVADKIDADLGYRYIGGLKISDSNIKAKVGSLYAGVNFRF